MTRTFPTLRPRRVVPQGLTLPELAVTMAIAGILALTAAPMVRNAMLQYAADEATQKFVGDLVEAQARAIKLNRAVTVQRMGLTGYRIDGGPTQPLPNAVQFQATSADSVRFASFGPPTTGAVAFTLQYRTRARTITVNAAGRIQQ